MQLEQKLKTLETRLKITRLVAGATGLAAVVLMFVGGTRAVGSFDPFDRDANPFSLALAGIYILCAATCSLAIATYFSRLRPLQRDTREEVRTLSLEQLRSEVRALRELVERVLNDSTRSDRQ